MPEFASPRDLLSAPSVLAPLVLRGAAPDTSIAAFQRPSQARPAHRARSAYLLGFVDLEQSHAPFRLAAVRAAALALSFPAIQVFRLAGRLPLLRTPIFAPC